VARGNPDRCWGRLTVRQWSLRATSHGQRATAV